MIEVLVAKAGTPFRHDVSQDFVDLGPRGASTVREVHDTRPAAFLRVPALQIT